MIIKKIKLFSLNNKKLFLFLQSIRKNKIIKTMFKLRINDPTNNDIGKKTIRRILILVGFNNLNELINCIL
tara:strand:- start:90 stop:302 length:213 start_codon:yes stop_codon:yes gene_type:complete